MRYFKAEIAYRLNADKDDSPPLNHTLYCSCTNGFPKSEDLRTLFYDLYGPDRIYHNVSWLQLREEEIPTDEVHLLV